MDRKTELIERYIHAVGGRLPRKNRADIQAELRSLLQDSLESQAGGEPSEEDVVNMLKEFGPPEKVAASYWPEGQYLIGPRLFPLFRLVVGIALTVFAIVQLVLLGVTAVFNPQELNLLEFAGGLFNSLIYTFGMIVLVFAVLQYFDVRPGTEDEPWDPLDLPEIDEPDQIKRGELIAGIVFGLIFIAFLVFFVTGRMDTIFGRDVQFFLNPVLTTFLPLIILSFLLDTVLDVYLLWRGRWTTATRLVKIGVNLFSIYILAQLLGGHNAWLAERGATGFFSSLENLPQGITSFPAETTQILVMQAFRMAFIIALIVTAVETAGQAYRLVRRLAGSPVPPRLPTAGG
ncbi:MAG TPA: hypothetical protein VI776_09470 [Anaerolineales bacterium]|nr:hypothetical protein [Anaerolineales bacterium]